MLVYSIISQIKRTLLPILPVLMFGEYAGLQLNRGKTKTLPLNFDNNETSCINN